MKACSPRVTRTRLLQMWRCRPVISGKAPQSKSQPELQSERRPSQTKQDNISVNRVSMSADEFRRPAFMEPDMVLHKNLSNVGQRQVALKGHAGQLAKMAGFRFSLYLKQ